MGPGQRARLAPGDFEDFYRSSRPWAVRLARLLVFDAAVAEELVQDSFVRAHERFASLDEPAAFLRTCVVNRCRSEMRRRGREIRYLGRSWSPPAEATPDARELLDAVARLPERQRTVVVLRYYLDLSERDIAATLGCRPGTVKSLSSRALNTLRKELPA